MNEVGRPSGTLPVIHGQGGKIVQQFFLLEPFYICSAIHHDHTIVIRTKGFYGRSRKEEIRVTDLLDFIEQFHVPIWTNVHIIIHVDDIISHSQLSADIQRKTNSYIFLTKGIIQIRAGFDPFGCSITAFINVNNDLVPEMRVFSNAFNAKLKVSKVIPA